MSALEQEEKAKADSDKVKLIEEFREGIELEIEDLCHEVIGLVEKKISPSAATDETRLFCLKMFGSNDLRISTFKAKANILTGQAIITGTLPNALPTTSAPLRLNWLARRTTYVKRPKGIMADVANLKILVGGCQVCSGSL